jgi:hypothetical protein
MNCGYNKSEEAKKSDWEAKKAKQAVWEAKRAVWEAKRAKWLAQYNSEFPSLSDTTPEHPDEFKINFIRERNKTRYEDYKAREKERSKAKREKYERLERIHAQECERILGPNWYSYPMLIGGEFDCELADVMRYEDDLEEQRAEWESECEYERKENEESWECGWDERQYERKESEESWECEWYNDASDSMHWIKKQQEELKERELRWSQFIEFNSKKPPYMVWNATKMKELLK